MQRFDDAILQRKRISQFKSQIDRVQSKRRSRQQINVHVKVLNS